MKGDRVGIKILNSIIMQNRLSLAELKAKQATMTIVNKEIYTGGAQEYCHEGYGKVW